MSMDVIVWRNTHISDEHHMVITDTISIGPYGNIYVPPWVFDFELACSLFGKELMGQLTKDPVKMELELVMSRRRSYGPGENI